jgi:nucleoside diphosphate kinase
MMHGTPLAPMLSHDARKRELYGADTYYLESAEQLAALGADVEDFAFRHAGLLLKPDAAVTRQLIPAIDWLVENGWRVVAAKPCRLDRTMVRALWQYQWNLATPYRRRVADTFLPSADSLVLVVRREGDPDDIPASVQLTEMKGPTNPDARQPSQLRYALGRYCYLLNLVHTADEPADVVRELGVHFSMAERREVYAAALTGEDRQNEARGLAELLYAQTPERDLSFEPAAKRLAAAMEALAFDNAPEPGTSEPATWQALIELIWKESLPVDPWDVATVAAYAFPMRRKGLEPILDGASRAQWVKHLDPATALSQTSRTVPRSLVHRRAIAEVFPTSVSRSSDGTFHIGTQLPRRHALFSDSLAEPPGVDPMFFIEVCRQSMFVVAHTYYDVPLGQMFILRHMSLSVSDPTLLAPRLDPAEAVVRCRETRRFRDRAGQTVGLDLDYRVSMDGRPTLDVQIGMKWVSPASWAAVRGPVDDAAPAPLRAARIPGHLIGRRDPTNVVITPVSMPADGEPPLYEAGVVVHTEHPTFFDHELDHLSGMLQLEAVRQLGVAVVSSGYGLAPASVVLRGFSVKFRSFGELHAPARAVAQWPGGDADLTVAVHQGDRVLTDGTLRLEHPSLANR